MGIGSDTIELLIRLQTGGLLPRQASIIEIGAQQLATSFLQATDRQKELAKLFEAAEPLPFSQTGVGPSRIVHGDLEHLDEAAPAARTFWKWLGFDYAAIDIDGSPGSIPLDLNYDSVPADVEAKYDLVTNFGTTEHVANQLNAFKVVHDLTAPGGLMVHQLPAQGFFNHGLVNYNF